MGIWDRIGRLLGRRKRTPLEKARAAAKVLGRDGRIKRRKRFDDGANLNQHFGSSCGSGGGGDGGGGGGSL